jgi:hypothetical protein
MEILQIAVALLIAELIVWELPQFLAKRVKLTTGVSICLAASLIAASLAFTLLATSPEASGILNPGIISFALFTLFAVGSTVVLWNEQRK